MKKVYNIPALILVAYSIRLLAFGASLGDALVTVGLCSVFALTLWIDSKKETPVNDSIKEEVKLLRIEVQKVADSQNSIKLGARLLNQK